MQVYVSIRRRSVGSGHAKTDVQKVECALSISSVISKSDACGSTGEKEGCRWHRKDKSINYASLHLIGALFFVHDAIYGVHLGQVQAVLGW